jgi:uncharacterized membrane protein
MPSQSRRNRPSAAVAPQGGGTQPTILTAQAQQRLTIEQVGLPTPEAVQGYARSLPDAPERFMALLEKQVEHRLETERKVMDANIEAMHENQRLQRLYAWMACVLALALITAFVIVSLVTRNGYVSAGGLVLTVGGIITTFLVNSRQRLRILQEQQRQIQQQQGNQQY